MIGTGNRHDNAPMQSFWHSLKVEEKRWLGSSAQQTPIIKWNLGGLMCDVALSTGCARRVVELDVLSTSTARGVQLVGKAGLIARV